MAWFSSLFRGNKARVRPAADSVNVRGINGALRRGPRIWAVGGGKGGVGKSLVASNFGIYLAGLGKRVLLVDADFGAANLHTIVGGGELKFTLSSFLNEGFDDIRNVIGGTDIPGLDLLGGSRDSSDAADLQSIKVKRLRAALEGLDYEFVIIDTGPGTSSNLLDIFLSAQRGILVTTPEPTSIENTHRFLRCLYLRRIKQVITEQEDCRLNDVMRKIFTNTGPSRPRNLADMLKAAREIDVNQWQALTDRLNRVSMSIIVNHTTRPEDSNLGPSMVQVWLDYFGLNVSFIGQIARDDSVPESVRTRRPLALSLGYSNAAWDLKKCVIKLLEEEKYMSPHLKAIS